MKTYDTIPSSTGRDRLLVGVSGYSVANGGETLVAYGLGACVAIALYDPAGVAGLAHAMLPRRTDGVGAADGKFVDAAIHAMLREMIEAGAGYGSIDARIVGGADIFQLDGLSAGAGEQNVAVARKELAGLDIPIVAEEVGGGRGRRVEFDAASGELLVRTVDCDAKQL